MSNRIALAQALAELAPNNEQYEAAITREHCVVLAGPGSGKTKTLTTAMARVLMDDVVDPRGVACITYNNECATELEERLAKFGVANSDRSFIGTVHSFALTQVIAPYTRCIAQLLPDDFRVATSSECRAAVEAAYKSVFGDMGNSHDRWRFAEEKRRRDVDRTLPAWKGKNPELATFIEAYEAELRHKALIDFDDMPLIAFRMIKEHSWIRDALRARFPVLFVDEYQDLGHALHELVLLLCFESGIRLFAVGDADQSIYGFNGANPGLLQSLTARGDVKTIRLRFNYRSGAKIIRASLGALGEERDYCGWDGAPEGDLSFWPVEGDLNKQARYIAKAVLPSLLGRGLQLEKIGILYRAAWLGDKVADALKETDIAILRTDGNALVRRNSRLARFVEACSRWVTGGWRDALPPYHRLLGQALAIVYGGRVSEAEEQAMTLQLMAFLRSGIDRNETTHAWLIRFCRELIAPWQGIVRNTHQEWEVCSELVARTDPALGLDMPLNVFSGQIDGSGRVTLSTLHSAKGREFDAAILFGINAEDFPNWRDAKSERAMREARRLFYVGVTRPRKELCLVFEKGNHSPWVAELYQRSQKV
ncbi:ATP-dependent helicase [Pseudomonas songnenensis]|uniref:DNA 3'-5' helicase n=1 Tax=Pseudomonas songnenensis TaxID=1176259 RepID=A0A482UBK3_9PSED|nr:ATP-dependent helicase [Pseudomonas songnenensis]RYJ59193.1 ATP-dependent helicase [Pseudomonas songnenensis]